MPKAAECRRPLTGDEREPHEPMDASREPEKALSCAPSACEASLPVDKRFRDGFTLCVWRLPPRGFPLA